MPKNTFKINNLSLDERILFMESFSLDLDSYVKHLGQDARVLCKTDEEYDEKFKRFQHFLKKRKSGFSVASIIGKKDFFEHTFFVDENVLIPRPETEEAVELAISKINEFIAAESFVKKDKNGYSIYNINVADVCTGSFCIGLSIYLHFLDRGVRLKLFASDISEEALVVAKKNLAYFRKTYMETNNFDISFDICLFSSNLFEDYSQYSICVNDKFDLIISNPPYVATKDKDGLSQEVLKEPSIALFAGEDGLSIIENLVKEAPLFLKEGGVLFLEHGTGQGYDVRAIFEKNGFKEIETIKDLTARPRFTKGVLV